MSNIVYVGGIVNSPITFEGDSLCVELKIYREDLGKDEFLTITATDREAVSRAVHDIHEGDYFLTTDAFLRTKTYIRDKELECSECYNVEYQKVKSEKTEVVFKSFTVLKLQDGMFLPGINKVILYGNICNEINYREKAGKGYCKYKLAVNQKVFDSDAEYPFVVTFGKDAELSKKYLKKNNRVFVEGSIQQREIKQKIDFVCPECGVRAEKRVPNIVREVITSTVVFLDKESSEDENV